jgi:hypothetical protein
MIDPATFQNFRLRGGFIITDIEFTDASLRDALQREAAAQTRILGRRLHIKIRRTLGAREVSVSLYHEVLEAAIVGSWPLPDQMMQFNEADFERAAQSAHEEWGEATPENVILMLQSYGFREE